MSSTKYAKHAAAPRFGEWLRQLRAAKDEPLRTVAAAADMDQAHLSKIELGQRLPTEEQTAKLAKFFGMGETEAQARRMGKSSGRRIPTTRRRRGKRCASSRKRPVFTRRKRRTTGVRGESGTI